MKNDLADQLQRVKKQNRELLQENHRIKIQRDKKPGNIGGLKKATSRDLNHKRIGSCSEPANIEIRKSGIFNSKRSLDFLEPPNPNVATVPPSVQTKKEFSVQAKSNFDMTKVSSKI